MKAWLKDRDFINFLMSMGALILLVALLTLGFLLIWDPRPGDLPVEIEPEETVVILPIPVISTPTATLPPTRTPTPSPEPVATKTKTPVPTNTPRATGTPSSTVIPTATFDPPDLWVHRIQAGDTLGGVSLQYYGTWTRWPAIKITTNSMVGVFPDSCLVGIPESNLIIIGNCVLVPVRY